jgi:2-amino-4-hydroxy-6-hydroxymethyldihydropteridine diphosphokinase
MDVPRQEILEYAHVLKPLSLILPDRRHPVNGSTYRELWDGMAPEHDEKLKPVKLDF